GARVRVDVPAMEGVRLLGAGAAVAGLVDLPQPGQPEDVLQVGEGAVVGGDDEVAGRGARHHGEPVRADAGVDHGDEHGALRPVGQDLGETVGGLPDVVGRDVVGEVVAAR